MRTLVVAFLLMLQTFINAQVYDCFTFFNELDLLKVRLEELYDSVDHFVIVESSISFTGKQKPIYFAENAQKFEQYKDKIIHIVIDYFPNLTGDPEKDHWSREEYSRNAILQGLSGCKDNDVILISDLDEIPNAAVISEIKNYLSEIENVMRRKNKLKIRDPQLVCNLQMRLFMYQMNRENFAGWLGGSKAAPYWIVKKYSPWGIKLFHHKYPAHVIQNAGWHFNTMGGKEKALYKWVNTGPIYYDGGVWLNELGKQEHLLEESYQGQVKSNTVVVPIDDSYPKYFLDNLDYFRSIGWIAE